MLLRCLPACFGFGFYPNTHLVADLEALICLVGPNDTEACPRNDGSLLDFEEVESGDTAQIARFVLFRTFGLPASSLCVCQHGDYKVFACLRMKGQTERVWQVEATFAASGVRSCSHGLSLSLIESERRWCNE